MYTNINLSSLKCKKKKKYLDSRQIITSREINSYECYQNITMGLAIFLPFSLVENICKH